MTDNALKGWVLLAFLSFVILAGLLHDLKLEGLSGSCVFLAGFSLLVMAGLRKED